MIDLTQAGSAFLIGLAGAGHCIGMCGGLAAALNLGGNPAPGMTVAYHAGRVTSYALLGALAGFMAGSIDVAAWTIALRYLAGILMIGMGLYIADWWHGMTLLERAGAALWQPVQRLSSRLLPLKNPGQCFALGLCWGMMPCGLIYSSLAWSATAQSAGASGLMMLIFGLGTLPAMLATSAGAGGLATLLRQRGLKRVIALLLVAAGVWTLYVASLHGAHHAHHHHAAVQPLSHHGG